MTDALSASSRFFAEHHRRELVRRKLSAGRHKTDANGLSAAEETNMHLPRTSASRLLSNAGIKLSSLS